jgi:hypothetical protein
LYDYPAGTGYHQVNEPWNASLTAYDPSQPEGRGSDSYATSYYNSFSVVSGILRYDNCAPP